MSADPAGHWSRQQERGVPGLLSLSVWLCRHCPQWLLRPIVAGVVGYFFLTAPGPRRCIRAYHTRLRTTYPDVVLPSWAPVWRQFLAFGQAIVDRFAVWQGRISYPDLVVEDPDGLYPDIQRSAQGGAVGQLLVCSHLGNVEICRALVSHNKGFALNVLVHSKHAESFNRALRQAGASEIRVIQVVELDLPLMMQLKERIEAGEWLAIAADRDGEGRFSGKARPDASGPLAAGRAPGGAGESGVLQSPWRALSAAPGKVFRSAALVSRRALCHGGIAGTALCPSAGGGMPSGPFAVVQLLRLLGTG